MTTKAERPARFSYASSLRLKKRWEFDAVFRTGRQQRGELVRMYFLPADEAGTRFGVAVGKKVANAVMRARGRRMLRESLRRLAPWVKGGHWIVLSLRERALQLKAHDVYADAAKVLARSGLLEESWRGPDWSVDAASQ